MKKKESFFLLVPQHLNLLSHRLQVKAPYVFPSSTRMSHQEGEEAEVEEEEVEEAGQDHIIFLIDARAAMRPHLLACLELTMLVTKAKVIASSKSSLGIILFGTRRKNEDVESCPENVFTLLALDPPSASRIKTLAVSPILIIGFWESFLMQL